eukprot:7131956-Pyramimonas_sp.AAC.1
MQEEGGREQEARIRQTKALSGFTWRVRMHIWPFAGANPRGRPQATGRPGPLRARAGAWLTLCA